jgi:hypothetical protein
MRREEGDKEQRWICCRWCGRRREEWDRLRWRGSGRKRLRK